MHDYTRLLQPHARRSNPDLDTVQNSHINCSSRRRYTSQAASLTEGDHRSASSHLAQESQTTPACSQSSTHQSAHRTRHTPSPAAPMGTPQGSGAPPHTYDHRYPPQPAQYSTSQTTHQGSSNALLSWCLLILGQQKPQRSRKRIRARRFDGHHRPRQPHRHSTRHDCPRSCERCSPPGRNCASH